MDLPANRQIHSVTDRAGPRPRELETKEVDNMHSMNVIETRQTEWVSPVVFVSNKDRSLSFCLCYCKWYAVK